MNETEQSGRVLVGVDGCRAGWMAVSLGPSDQRPLARVFGRFAELVENFGTDAILAVDMPIGLPDRITGAGRGPEQAIRPHLGARRSSVFSIPARAAVEAESYREACDLAQHHSEPSRKVSKQAFNLFGKILEIDSLLRSDLALCNRIIECHPEFAFCRLNGMKPMTTPKKIRGSVNPEGLAERVQLLVSHGFDRDIFAAGAPRGAALDDLVDASVNLLVAGRHARGLTETFPAHPLRDRYGIPIAIHG